MPDQPNASSGSEIHLEQEGDSALASDPTSAENAAAYDGLTQSSDEQTQVIIVRHGNTFEKGDVVKRVGKHTDLPLSQSGIKQAKALGKYLATHHPDLAAVYTSSLQRTRETAQIALSEAGLTPPLTASGDFDEIDYGPDENKPENEVVARLGQPAIDAWDNQSIPPADWKVNPEALKQTWRDFFQKVRLDYSGKTVMVVTSNGIARFAPYCLKHFEQWETEHRLKMGTGALSIFSYEQGQWQCKQWNIPPASAEA